MSENREVLRRVVGTLRCGCVPPNASVQWEPDGLTIHTNKWFLGAGFLGAPSISLIAAFWDALVARACGPLQKQTSG